MLSTPEPLPMDATPTPVLIPARLGTVVLLGRLLQQLESRPRGVSAAQYRALVRRLAEALEALPADADTQSALRRLMDLWPALAEVYENLHYRHAGLLRAPVDAAARAELAAREAIERAATRR